MNVLHLTRMLSFNETTLELIQNTIVPYGCLDACQKNCTTFPLLKKWTEMSYSKATSLFNMPDTTLIRKTDFSSPVRPAAVLSACS